jgi:hypothetical protein
MPTQDDATLIIFVKREAEETVKGAISLFFLLRMTHHALLITK